MLRIELSPNLEYLITLPGFGKLLTIVFGAIVVGLGGHAQEANLSLWKEILFLYATILCFIISFFYLLALCFSDQLVCSKINKIIDIVYHITAGVVQIGIGSLMLNSAVLLRESECKYISPDSCENFGEKLGAGVFAILVGLIYIGTAAAIQKVKSL